jgi:hypothetical protein
MADDDRDADIRALQQALMTQQGELLRLRQTLANEKPFEDARLKRLVREVADLKRALSAADAEARALRLSRDVALKLVAHSNVRRGG